MMRTKKINYTFLLLLITVGLMSSCVKDDDFNTPDTSINPPEIDGDTISISGVKAMFAQEVGSDLNNLNGDEQFNFQSTDLYMTGYVVSSDESGNFYQEMVLQDKPENPTSGIKIMLSANPLFTKFELGRKVYVELDGFTIGLSNGVIALGVPKSGSDFISKAPEAFESKIIRTPQLDSIVPLEMSISDFNRSNENLYIKLDNVEFPAELVLGDHVATFAAEQGDDFDGERTLESCDNNNTTSLLTSTFADFKALSLPQKKGSIAAVLSKTFNGSSYVLKINSPSDIHFEQDRCDGETPGNPSEPGDGDQTIVGIPFQEDFESLSDYDPIDNLEGWTNQDVSGSSRIWEARGFGGNEYAQLTAFGSNTPVEAWMVTPGIDLGSANAPELTFDTKDGHYNGDALSVYISTDFDGDAASANWTEITNASLSQGHSDYADNFTSSGNIDLSSYVGQVIFVGFKYEGSDNGISSTYQVDNVSVAESGDGDGDNPEPPTDNATLAFAGGDFENWQDFIDGLNSYGIMNYATESNGTGVDGSTSLQIATDPTTTNGNDYVFTARATADLPSSYSKISFYMKGTADKSVSLNVYKSDGSYYPFNLGDISEDAIIEEAGNNQYTGTINTGGDWVLISLDLSDISDLNTSDTSGDFFALKIGKNVNYDLKFDDFTIE